MNLREYTRSCLKTWKDPDWPTTTPGTRRVGRILHAAMGLCGEAGEVSEWVKKAHIYGRRRPVEDLELELGDVLYYWAILCYELGVDPEEVMRKNIEKLSKRYEVRNEQGSESAGSQEEDGA